MNKLIGILACTAVCTLSWVIVNYIALGTSANYQAVTTLGVVCGLIIGIACVIYNEVNPIIMGMSVTLTVWLSMAAVLFIVKVGHLPAISLELLLVITLMIIIGAISGFGYKIAARV